MIAEPAFSIGQRVRLLRLDDEFYSGLDPEDIEVLKTLVGRVWIVEGFHNEISTVELRYPRKSGDSPLRWITVPLGWIERK